MRLKLGEFAYKRIAASAPEIRLENRYFEANPTDAEGAALLARAGTSLVVAAGDGPLRRSFAKKGLFGGDLFIVSGGGLFRYDGTSLSQVTGTVQAGGAPNFAWMKGIGYEYLFIADGLLLQCYAGGSHAVGLLSSDTYDYAWDTRTSPEDNHWRGVCWSPDLALFVAVSSEDSGDTDTHLVMTSPDGTTWTARTDAGAGHGWEDVTWAPEIALLVAVGNPDNGTAVMTSTDGTTWTSRTTTTVTTGVYNAVCWSSALTLFVAVGDAGLLMTSPDGVNWTDQVAAVANNWESVCWSPELLLFCATASTGIGNRVMTSPDGINWEVQVSPADVEWSGVCWSPELKVFCAVSDAHAMTSPDGKVWTLYNIPNVSGHGLGAHKVCWSPELRLFTAVGFYGVATSPDGVTWTLRTAASANEWSAVCWSPDLLTFAAVSTTGVNTRVMTSDAKATPVIAGQVFELGGTYYSWDANVDTGTPDGTPSAPWLALLGSDDIASLANMAKLLNYAGTPGTDFSTALPGPSDIVTASAVAFTLTVTSIATDAATNAITTTVYLGSDIAWGAATLTGGNVHVLAPIAVPDEQPVLALASLAGYVLLSISNSQKIFWIQPAATTIAALDFAEKESAPDNIIDMQTVGDFVFIMGSGSTEIWYATGQLDAPFAPQQGASYERGVIAGTPTVIGADGLAFIGNDGKAYLLAGSGLERISNHGIEERIRRWLRAQDGLTP